MSRKWPVIAIITFVVVGLLIDHLYYKYQIRPLDTALRCRSDCWAQMVTIRLRLLEYQDLNNNTMPIDLQELFTMIGLERSRWICPSQLPKLRQMGLVVNEGFSLYISSYRLMVPLQDFNTLPDGTVIVREIEGDHPAMMTHGRYYPAGCHAIIKDGDNMKVVFLKTEEEKVKSKPAESP